jgi:PAS domain S-box-containing protein
MTQSDSSSLSSGLLLKRLLPAALLLTIVAGLLRYAGEQAGLFGPLVGVLLMVVFTVLTLSALIGAGAVAARRIENHDRHLNESLRLFREFFNASIDMFVVASFEGYFTDVNPACSSILGYTPEELKAKPFMSLVHPDDVDATLHEMAKLSEGVDTISFENRYRCHDGSYKLIDWQSRSLVDQGLIYAVARDVTSRRTAEHELREQQRRESLGVLAGGIAHDFNNLLVGVIGNADVLTRELADSPQGETAEQIKVAGRRAAELTRQMLAYSGKGRFVVESLSMSALIHELVPLLESVISKKAELTLTCPEGIPAIQGDATQIRQVVMNLLTNASDSLDDQSGKISVQIGEVEADAGYLSQFTAKTDLPEGRYVFVEISDTGRGMDAATRGRIFDPYFTTKFTGSGLGLAAVHGIVEGHGGGLRIYSEPGRGTTFTVLFPAVAGGVHESTVLPAATLPAGLEVLLADDEEIVRAIAKRMLEGSGCIVTAVHDGLEAVSVFEEDPHRFDCVVLDLMMPGFSGEEAFEQMRRTRPDVPILISSGYNAQEVSTRFASTESAAFLQKPYGLQELNAALSEATRRAGALAAA